MSFQTPAKSRSLAGHIHTPATAVMRPMEISSAAMRNAFIAQHNPALPNPVGLFRIQTRPSQKAVPLTRIFLSMSLFAQSA